MTSATTMGRTPITIVEIEQPRCIHRFGTSPCTARASASYSVLGIDPDLTMDFAREIYSIGPVSNAGTVPRCYNTASTCGDLENYTPTGSIKWRFMDDRPGTFNFADFTDLDNQELPPIPCTISVSTSAGEINAGANLDGRSALGVTSKVNVRMQDFLWNDRHGDFYLTNRTGYQAGRPPPDRANFWALWTARNKLFNDMFVRVYDGYEGQALADMRSRIYVLDAVDGPNGDGGVTLTGLDPLRLTAKGKAEFPRTSVLELYGGVDASTTTMQVFGNGDDLTAGFGNTGSDRWLSIGSELIKYTGNTDEGDGIYTLTGVVRGDLGTVAEEHSDQDKVQRAGRYVDEKFWRVLNDLLVNHTDVPASFIPLDDWDAEGDRYLPSYSTTHTIVEPSPVSVMASQLAQQGLFYIWWQEYAQEIQMLAVRPPDAAPDTFTDESNLMRGTLLKRDPTSRLSQVSVYYNQIDVFGNLDDDVNYKNRFTAVNGDNLGETRSKAIYAPWIRNRTQAVQLAVRLLIRYRDVPEFLTFSVDAKDRTATLGTVLDIDTRTILDTEGNTDPRRWQVISSKELEAGHSYLLKCQTYEFFGRFGRFMADGSPDYSAATTEQRLEGGWFAADTGLMSDGTEGYKYQ